MVKNNLSINLTEDVVFLRGSATGEDSRGRRVAPRDDLPPAMLRGVVTLTLAKSSRIKRIDVTLEGKARTEWPEGIGARRTEIHEEHTIFEISTTLFSHDLPVPQPDRSSSVAPTVRSSSVAAEPYGDPTVDWSEMSSALSRAIRPSSSRSSSRYEPTSAAHVEEERGRARLNLNHVRGPSPAYTRTPSVYVPMRSSSPINESSRSPSRSRGRAAGFKALTGALGVSNHSEDDEPGSRSGSRSGSRMAFEKDEERHWKEFRKGEYNYPISFTIPPSTPPTIHADFGSVIYRLRATVYRSGALTTNMYDEKEVRMVACPGEDDTDESENVIVERQWEDQLRYLVALSGKSFPIGGSIPLSLRLMPFEKMKIYRISVMLEEKIDYFAHDKKVARHEAVRRHQLLALKHLNAHKAPVPLLPIDDKASDALQTSPLASMVVAAGETGTDEDDALSSLLNPTGPWLMDQMLQVPDTHSKLHFTTKHAQTNMTVAHCLKVVFRVERGDDKAIDSKGKRKQFDIIIETPITILDSRCNIQYTSLPKYDTRVVSPPSYDDPNYDSNPESNPHGIVTRTRDVPSRSQSRAPSRSQSRAPSRSSSRDFRSEPSSRSDSSSRMSVPGSRTGSPLPSLSRGRF
ncbi:Thioredoxin binding protein TBP-2/VDUP1 [Phaffia rhodozyma]|uniref:Thioredoxin binding protein TBP-2/VDUP1 n=1 Tax=Phaffia rhodozyma TaxID=264483 RepID=A0A0F7SEU7_PHARH|nr:Thioredoxin binding protein TBP-2/VDUP1 [Phaffia rhodozyma]